MRCSLSEYPDLPAATPAMLGVVDDGSAIPPDQAANLTWDNAPGLVKAGAFFGMVTKDQFTSGFAQLNNQGIQLVQASAPPTNAYSPDALYSAISSLVTNEKDRQQLDSGRSYLASTVQNLWNKGLYFVNSGSSAAPTASTYTTTPSSSTGLNQSVSSTINSFVSPISALFAPSQSRTTYQSSGFRAGGLRTAQKTIFSTMNKRTLVLAAAIGGVLLIGIVLIGSAD